MQYQPIGNSWINLIEEDEVKNSFVTFLDHKEEEKEYNSPSKRSKQSNDNEVDEKALNRIYIDLTKYILIPPPKEILPQLIPFTQSKMKQLICPNTFNIIASMLPKLSQLIDTRELDEFEKYNGFLRPGRPGKRPKPLTVRLLNGLIISHCHRSADHLRGTVLYKDIFNLDKIRKAEGYLTTGTVSFKKTILQPQTIFWRKQLSGIADWNVDDDGLLSVRMDSPEIPEFWVEVRFSSEQSDRLRSKLLNDEDENQKYFGGIFVDGRVSHYYVHASKLKATVIRNGTVLQIVDTNNIDVWIETDIVLWTDPSQGSWSYYLEKVTTWQKPLPPKNERLYQIQQKEDEEEHKLLKSMYGFFENTHF